MSTMATAAPYDSRPAIIRSIVAVYRAGGLALVARAGRTTVERVQGWVAESEDLRAALAAVDEETSI